MTPFQSNEEALAWLQSLMEGERAWRIEINSDWRGRHRYFQVRAYPMENGDGWYCGEDETLIGALAWLRHATERMGEKPDAT
jgi:hypothetical protein